jgi:hypothetical protein
MVGMSQEQSALFWQSLTWKFVLRTGLVKESICHTSPSLLQNVWGNVSVCWRLGVFVTRAGKRVSDVRRRSRGSATLPPRTREKRVTHMQRSPNAARRTPNAERRTPNADTPNADTPIRLRLLGARASSYLFVKHVFAFWRFVSGCNLG